MRSGRERDEERKDYAAVRFQVRSGDLLLFQGTSRLSRFIRWVTDSKYSHCGIAMWWRPTAESLKRVPTSEASEPPTTSEPMERLMVFEAVGRGVVCSPASKSVFRYSGQVDWYRLDESARKIATTERIFDLCLHGLGRPYGTWGMVRFFGRWVLDKLGIKSLEDDASGRVGAEGDSRKMSPSMFCSWYVSEVFARLVDLDPKHADSLTTPNDLAESDLTHYSGTLQWNKATADTRFDQPDSAAEAA